MDADNFDMQGLFCTKFMSERLRTKKDGESEEKKRSPGGAAGSAEGIRETGATEGYQNGRLMEGSEGLKRVSNHESVKRARIGSPVIGGERDFEVAEKLFNVSYNELRQKEARVVENWIRESRINKSYLRTHNAYVSGFKGHPSDVIGFESEELRMILYEVMGGVEEIASLQVMGDRFKEGISGVIFVKIRN